MRLLQVAKATIPQMAAILGFMLNLRFQRGRLPKNTAEWQSHFRAGTNLAQTSLFLEYRYMIRNYGVQILVEEMLWQPDEDFLKAEVSCSGL